MPPEIALHLATALFALAIGPFTLYRRRRDRLHKVLGYAWVSAMAVSALSALFIASGFAVLGPFSPIHLLVPYVLWGLWDMVRRARAGDIAGHRAIARQLYWLGLVLPGVLTVLPGRTLSRALFPDAPMQGLAAVGIAALLAWALAERRMRLA